MKRTHGLERVIRARAPWKRNFSGGGSKMQLDSLCRGGAKVLQDPGRMCWDLMEPGRREELHGGGATAALSAQAISLL